jgi:uncharacterized damage-inducible protein DinB
LRIPAAKAMALLLAFALSAWCAVDAQAGTATEYSQHFGALSKLSVAVAEAMPPEQYTFRPDPGSMTFGEMMSHIASTNFAFCAGLTDADTPNTLAPGDKDKDAIVKFLSSSFDYCAAVIPDLTDEQLSKVHDSPDGRLPGRAILLALYVHVAHHRGQAEIYLRDKGIKPPSYRI